MNYEQERPRLMAKYGIDEKDIVRDPIECALAKYDWEWFDTVAGYFSQQKYRFAKTLKENPHFYTLRKLWKEDAHFEDVIIYMRMVGYTEYYYGTKYNMLNINNWKYWTMRERINKDGKPWTILINRKHIDMKGTRHYDYIADEYDWYFRDTESMKENEDIMNIIDYHKGESILDIGCGTGLFMDFHQDIDYKDYVGIDVSEGMLSQFFKKHGNVNCINCAFEDFYIPQRFDKIISLFGSFSYIDTIYAGKVIHYLKPGGRAILMFYADGYHPVTYEKANVEIPSMTIKYEHLNGWDIEQYGNYIIVQYTKE